MTVKLRAIDRWQRATGAAIPLPGGRRTVTIQVNVDEPTKLTVFQEGSGTLLRAVQPWECPLAISFVVEGDCTIVPETEGELWWMSDDGDILAFPVLTESFTKLEQRMDVTPEMEITILKANFRHERRQREVAELLLAKAQREQAEAANADPETGELPNGEDGDGVVAATPKPKAVAGNSPVSEKEPAGDGDAP